MEQTCTHCLLTKPLADFYIVAANRSGHEYRCKKCTITHKVARKKDQRCGKYVPKIKNQEKVQLGAKFGRLTVVGDCYYKRQCKSLGKVWFAPCICVCGKEVAISVNHLLQNATLSCGCYRDDLQRKRLTTHGHTAFNNKSPLFRVWCTMRERCENPKNRMFLHYGGRGIFVYHEWQKYENFLSWAMSSGYAPGFSIDRIDNDLPYHPENCQWADAYTQANNKSNNVIIEAWGEEKTIANWSRDPRCKVSYPTLRYRLQKSYWEPERAISLSPMYKYTSADWF